ncbi:TetR/AcrR family transcriptional regulator [Subtercola lobariae]|uniref:TetR/AcrR family transcriptional regulator n=1 Tax=Subtercola lobariae TaxID=1588641 RepID=UPI00166F5C55|nr:TetR/AcrR family transcriptional regulator [Subtercola lobariae]
MSSENAPVSDYRSRQKRAGDALRQETRHRLLEAAANEFAANGYAATTVTRLAASAGVSVQTLYLAWGSKRALLRGYVEDALSGSAATPAQAAEHFSSDMSPIRRLHELASLVTDIAARASLGWTLYRDAAAIDPEIASDWNELQLLRHQLFTTIVSAIPDEALTPGLTRETAVDTAWALASPETFELLCHRLSYSLDDFRDWLSRTLPRALLAFPQDHN